MNLIFQGYTVSNTVTVHHVGVSVKKFTTVVETPPIIDLWYARLFIGKPKCNYAFSHVLQKCNYAFFIQCM